MKIFIYKHNLHVICKEKAKKQTTKTRRKGRHKQITMSAVTIRPSESYKSVVSIILEISIPFAPINLFLTCAFCSKETNLKSVFLNLAARAFNMIL